MSGSTTSQSEGGIGGITLLKSYQDFFGRHGERLYG